MNYYKLKSKRKFTEHEIVYLTELASLAGYSQKFQDRLGGYLRMRSHGATYREISKAFGRDDSLINYDTTRGVDQLMEWSQCYADASIQYHVSRMRH